MAIKCFVPGCTEDVTGQCPGTGGESCGHFYCERHSRGKLCDECAAVKRLRDLLQEYLHTAENIYKPKTGWRICGVLFGIPAVLGLFWGISSFFFLTDPLWVVLIIGGFSLFMYILAMYKINALKKDRLQQAYEKYENFEAFYKEYKKYANKAAMLSTFGHIINFSADMLSSDPVMAGDVRRIRQRLERT